jgi:LytR cell envelope-related transcriptional attenuator
VTPPTPPGDRPGSESGPLTSVARLLLTQLAAVIGVAAVITVVFAFAGLGTGPDDSVTAGSSGGSSTSTSTSATGAPSTPASTTPAETTSAAPPTSETDSPSVDPLDNRPEVDVLNQSAGKGAAAETAQTLRDDGWEIGRVDNFRGNISTTTVYWLDRSDRRDARRLGELLGGVRVQEGFSTLRSGRLSVILVD